MGSLLCRSLSRGNVVDNEVLQAGLSGLQLDIKGLEQKFPNGGLWTTVGPWRAGWSHDTGSSSICPPVNPIKRKRTILKSFPNVVFPFKQLL